jgi:hypothetical protein
MASIFDRVDAKVEYMTWRDAVNAGFKDSGTIIPWFRYMVPIQAEKVGLSVGLNPSLELIYEEMARFFPERKAHPILGPEQDQPSRLCYKTKFGSDAKYIEIINPTTDDLLVVVGIANRACRI